jgi:hypothetical protein
VACNVIGARTGAENTPVACCRFADYLFVEPEPVVADDIGGAWHHHDRRVTSPPILIDETKAAAEKGYRKVEISQSDQSLSLGATFQRSPPDPAPEFGYCGKMKSPQTRGMVSALSELQSRHS